MIDGSAGDPGSAPGAAESISENTYPVAVERSLMRVAKFARHFLKIVLRGHLPARANRITIKPVRPVRSLASQEFGMRKWQMQEAKAKFADVVRRAGSEGPQIVTYRGADAAVVLSIDEYRQLQTKKPNLVEFLLSGPKWDEETIVAINNRSEDTGRDIDL
jgi:antitoxin Phd